METYHKLSPFTYALELAERGSPLLLIHGDNDNNAGTHPMQSERMYQAVSGQGGVVKLVILPHESHGYKARESIMHTLAEQVRGSPWRFHVHSITAHVCSTSYVVGVFARPTHASFFEECVCSYYYSSWLYLLPLSSVLARLLLCNLSLTLLASRVRVMAS